MRRPDDSGTALVLMPAALLALFVMAAVSADMALVHLAHREAADVAATAANTAVAAGVDQERLRAGEQEWHLDDELARAAVGHVVEGSRLHGELLATEVHTAPAEVTVTLRVRVDYMFAGALPGADDTTISATARATAARR